MILKIDLLPVQFEALAIVLKAMKIRYYIDEAEEAYERKVDENLLKMMLEQEKEGLKLLSHEESLRIHIQEKTRLGL